MILVVDQFEEIFDETLTADERGAFSEVLAALVQSGHVNLIETLAERIADHCLADRRVAGVRVRIEKPEAVPSCRSVGIEIERHRPASS